MIINDIKEQMTSTTIVYICVFPYNSSSCVNIEIFTSPLVLNINMGNCSRTTWI